MSTDMSASTEPELQAETRDVELAITGMTCASCSARVEKKLNRLEGVEAVAHAGQPGSHPVAQAGRALGHLLQRETLDRRNPAREVDRTTHRLHRRHAGFCHGGRVLRVGRGFARRLEERSGDHQELWV